MFSICYTRNCVQFHYLQFNLISIFLQFGLLKNQNFEKGVQNKFIEEIFMSRKGPEVG